MDELLRQLLIQYLVRSMKEEQFRDPVPQFDNAPSMPLQMLRGPLESSAGDGTLLHGLLSEPLCGSL